MANNVALYDAVVAGAGGSIQAWPVDQVAGDYALFANAVAAIATTVDLQIPPIVGGPSVSQVNLLNSITQNVLAGRFAVDATLALYVNLGKSISTIFASVSPKLLGAGGSIGKVTSLYFVDPLNASATATVRNGTMASPYISIAEALAAAVTAGLTKVQVLLAGIDTVNFTVPHSLTNVCIKGWSSLIGNSSYFDRIVNIIVLDTPAGGTQLQFDSISCNASITQSLGNTILLTNCKLNGPITGTTGSITIVDSEVTNNITYAGPLTILWDDASYTAAKVGGGVISGVTLTNTFIGIGPRRYVSAVVINGVAIGTTAQGSTALAAAVAGMHGHVTPTAPVAADFAVAFKYTVAGNVYWTLTNISRVSTNFNEAVEFLLLNGGLI